MNSWSEYSTWVFSDLKDFFILYMTEAKVCILCNSTASKRKKWKTSYVKNAHVRLVQ